jgi:hypothetical protein
MLKILINNEEVVCDKQLEIKEEMLSTSSCILNNCYPKSWENTKDYTSHYYYPKDYSKCVIKDEVNVPAEEGEYATGTNLNINVDNTKEWNYQLQGDTQQNASILPSGYTQVDYIESSGTQYIDSGILPSENIGFEIDFTPHNDMNKTTAKTIFGSRTTWKSNGYQLTTYTEGSLNGGHFLFGTNNTASLIRHSAYMQKDVRCQISFLNGVFKSANGNETNIQGTFSNVNKNIYLFGCIENANPFELSTTTLYKLKFYDNNVLIRDFIPCYRNSDNVVGMYDIVNNVFYTNQGTGAFTYGSVVNIPNPDYPQNINVVTGEQDVEIVGKNLFDKDNINILNGYLWQNQMVLRDTLTDRIFYIPCQPNSTYTISRSILTNNFRVATYNDEIPTVTSEGIVYTCYNEINNNDGTTITITTDSNSKYLLVMYANSVRDSNIEESLATIQVEVGSQATSYASYQSQNYPINLGKNLFDKDNANIINGWFDTNTTNLTSNANARTLYIKCLPNTTYTITKLISLQFNVGCTNNLPSIGTIVQKVETGHIGNYDSNVKVNYTYTTNNTAQYLLVRYAYSTQVDLDLMISSIQIEKGNVATEYASYITPIELCKIGNYQDYIYNQNGDWYLHKETNKFILNGTQNITAIVSQTNTTRVLYSGVLNSNPSTSENYPCFSNYFNYLLNWSIDKEGIYTNNNDIVFRINKEKATTKEEVNQILSQMNLEVLYSLKNPQDTQITDTTLIEQLDNLKNATLFNGVNNINVEGYLPSILYLHYNFVTARTDTTLLFSGVVKNTGNINLNPRYPHYCNLEVLDFKTFLSECDQLDFVINNKTITEAIEQVTQAVASYGFVVGNININDNTIIGAYSTQEKTPYDVFRYLADISQSRWYTRLVDENTVAIDFYDPTVMQRGIDLDFSDNTFACQNNVEDLSFNYGTYDYRNKQIMLSNQVFGGVDFEETIVSDGYNKIFNTTTPIGILKGITVNGSSATFATNEDKEFGLEADFYYTHGNAQIESNENDGTYPANTIIVVVYTPLVKGRQVINNTTEINRIATQTGRNGTISRYEKRNDVLSSDELELIGNSYLKYKGTPEINLTVVTKDVDLYNIGQIVYFNYPNIQDLSKDYMVKSKKTRIINTANDWNIWYTYTLTSNFNSENAINYFDNQRAKSTGNIQVGDYITRNVDIENSCMIIFSNPTATEITVTGNNILNAPLNAPLTQ